MTHARHVSVLLPFAAAAALGAGCAAGGSGEKLGPDVAAPTLNQPADRTTATVTPTPADAPVADTRVPRETRSVIPPELKAKAPLDERYRYLLFNYLPVNERGQNELGLLLRRYTPLGWELYQVRVRPVGHSQAIFRRPKTPGVPTTPTRRVDVEERLPRTNPPRVTPPVSDGPGAPSSPGPIR